MVSCDIQLILKAVEDKNNFILDGKIFKYSDMGFENLEIWFSINEFLLILGAELFKNKKIEFMPNIEEGEKI